MVAPSNTPREIAATPDVATLSYEAAVAELETLVGAMERGDLTLEESLAAYQRGAALAAAAQARLKDAEAQVRVLEEGLLKPFSSQSSSRVESDDE